MSALQRSSRSRLKQSAASRSPATSDISNTSTTNRRKMSSSQTLDKRKISPSTREVSLVGGAENEVAASPKTEPDPEEPIDSTEANAEEKNTSSHSAAGPASPVSDASSSSLSDIEDGPESAIAQGTEGGESDEPDTEAETERLEESPLKKRKVDGQGDSAVADSLSLEVDQKEDILEDDETSVQIDSRLGREPGNKKRKRMSSGATNGSTNEAPPSKRSASSRPRNALQRLASIDEVPMVDSTIADDQSDASSTADAEKSNDQLTGEDIPADVASDQDNEEITHPVDEGAGSEDIEEPIAEEGEEDAVDAMIRGEDEAARKKLAMDSLKPIEKLFAIFRDRLFDERLALLSAELELLSQPNITHPEFIAMRKSIDARRDEKVHLEHIALGYRIKALEIKSDADRAQLHSQYFQSVREIRDEHISNLYDQQCRIKREMRQWNRQETDFQYIFDPRRASQIVQQQAYNTEVSILSGLARYVGFPAAPEIKGMEQAEIDDDLRRMKVHTQPAPYLGLLANSRAATAAAEEQFIEKTPWANPNHPASQQALIIERQASAQQSRANGTFTSPSAPGWMATGPSAASILTDQQTASASQDAVSGQTSKPPEVISSEVFPNSEKYGVYQPNTERLPSLSKTLSNASFANDSTSQTIPTSTMRSDQSSNVYDARNQAQPVESFPSPNTNNHLDTAAVQKLPVKHEDDHDRYRFSAAPSRDSQLAGGALPRSILMQLLNP